MSLPFGSKVLLSPIHKKGDKQQPGNYRPISLTSVIGKILESIVRDQIMEHCMKNDLFSDAQHGFVPGRSCMTQLLTVLENWTLTIDTGHPVDVIYLDFKKAFDSVPHQRLLTKLKSFGIGDTIRNWLESFLTGRTQRVIVNGAVSNWSNVKSGIPQGSVLGPILFVLFINDLPDAISSEVKIFADDTKIYRPIVTIQDKQLLQDDIVNLQEWSEKWQLKFNEDKCKVMHIGPHNPDLIYTMNNANLKACKFEKDLGVIIDEDLKFHNHVSEAVKKANKILGLIKHTFKCLDIDTVPTLYKSLVRPYLEYGNVIWYPRYKSDAIAIEKIQKRATKIISSISHLPYKERLKVINLPSLQHRRRRGDMIQAYKIVSGIDRLDPNIFFEQPKGNMDTRGHSSKMFKKSFRTNLRMYSFSNRIHSDWNSLPDCIVNSKTPNTFKSN